MLQSALFRYAETDQGKENKKYEVAWPRNAAKKTQRIRLVHGSELLDGAGGIPENAAVPCEPVPHSAVPVPRKTPVPDGWKLAEGLVALLREDAVAVSTTVSMIWTSVTR